MQPPKSPPQPHPTAPSRIQTPQESSPPPMQTPHQASSSPTSRQVSSPSAPPLPSPRNEAVGSPVPLSYPPPPNLTPTKVTRETTPVEWSTGLCGCYSDLPNCIITCFCPCITFGEISEIVDRGTSTCAINGAIYTLLVVVLGFACVYSAFYRNRMRHQFNLEGSSCGDCCIHSFCELCALCQEYRELKLRGYDMGIGWHANIERQNHEAMTTPPPHSSMRR